MAPLYDIIVYGASGFTGRLCVRYLLNCSSSASTKFAAAGRSEGKLKEVLSEIGAAEVPVVIADSHDEEALTRMVKQTRVVITTVGPYALYGSTLAKVCSQNGVHCVDLTGEPLWSYEMKRLYDEDAERTKAILIHGAGFDSVPSDLNTLLAVRKLQSITDTPVGNVVSFVKGVGGVSGGTISTALVLMDEVQDSSKAKLMKDPYILSPVKGSQKVNMALSYRVGKEIGAAWFMEPANGAVVRQTWGTLEDRAQKDPSTVPYGPYFRYREHLASSSRFAAALTSFVLYATAVIFGSSKMLRNFFQKYVLPKAGSGPSEKTMNDGWFRVVTIAKTHDEKKAAQSIVKGKGDPGYLGTSIMMCEAALGLAHDYDRLTPIAKEGGHLTAATVFGEDVLRERLEATGRFTFETSVLQ